MGLPADSDDHLVARAHDGDTIALGMLLDRHLHPAWRIAVATSADATSARGAVVAGFCDALLAAARHPGSTVSLRTRIVAAVHRAAAADSRSRRADVPAADPVLVAFATLPTSSRTALWLTEVEGGTVEQIAPVLGLDRTAATALVRRASSALRSRIAATGAEADASPRAALRRLVVPIPDALPFAIAERWAQVAPRQTRTWFHAMNQRAVGAAAAVLLAVGLAGAAFVGRDDDDDPEFAAPASGATTGGGDPATELLDPVLPAAPAGPTSVASAGFGRGSGGAGGDDKPGAVEKAPTKTAAAPVADPSPAAAPPAAPAATADEPAVPAPSLPPTDTQVVAELPGVVVGLGDETGVDVAGTTIGDPPAAEGEPTIAVDLPVLPPISLP